MTQEETINHKQMKAIKGLESLLYRLKNGTAEIVDIQDFQNINGNFGVNIIIKNIFKRVSDGRAIS